jgi:hypothetical protein
MNPNYVAIIKQDLDELLLASFIKLMEQATWLSPIMVVPKKNNKLHIRIEFWKLNAATKKNSYQLPFTDKVLDKVMRCTHSWTVFLDTVKFKLPLKTIII